MTVIVTDGKRMAGASSKTTERSTSTPLHKAQVDPRGRERSLSNM